MTVYTKTEQKLIDAMSEMDIIDAHEHLEPEQNRTGSPVDVFILFAQYNMFDLFSAGMTPEQHQSLFDHNVPIETRWKTFAPFYRHTRHGSYARASRLTAKLLYGFDDINDDTYKPLSEAIAAGNTPGLYKRILCDRCRIRVALTQCSRTDVAAPLVPLMPGRLLLEIHTRLQLQELADGIGKDLPRNLEDWVELMRAYLNRWIDEGTIGIKITSHPNEPSDRKQADASLKHLLNGETVQPNRQGFEHLGNYLLHELLEMAAELNLTVAVHAGIWGDFRNNDCKHMLTLAKDHPQTRFDLYHLGMPSVRDCIVIGKNLSNVYLNLTWCHILSQVQACSGVDELLDQVPVNKIMAFGGDYRRPVENIVGHLHMARENFATVFGRRIDRGLLSFEEAMEILQLWFWDNPVRFYPRLELPQE